MSRILVLGIGPLLEGNVRNFSAHALRTWHLVSPLIEAGHEVRLITFPIKSDDPAEQSESGIEKKNFAGFSYEAFLNHDERHNLRALNEVCAQFHPDALLGINSYPCYLLAKADSTAPMWADFNGWLLVEAQVKSAVHGNNFHLGRYWEMEEAPLRRADKFSAVSMRQYYALLGELGSVGRLNRHTFNYPFAHFIPNAYNPFFIAPDAAKQERQYRGNIFPDNAFAVLWSGGYNSWTNVDILFQAVERAMREAPELHYVSTGGAIHGHDDLTYEKFCGLVDSSPLKDRFHLLGWVPAEELPSIYSACNLGLCVDADNYETMFGARNRTINMMAAGLPVLTTLGAEISEELVEADCAIGCRVADVDDLARALIAANWRRDQLRQMGSRGREYIVQNFSYAETTRDLVAWAAHPAHAPDNSVKISRAAHGDNPFGEVTNPIEARFQARSAPNTNASLPPAKNSLKTAARSFVGETNWRRLRYLRRKWVPETRRWRREALTRQSNPSSVQLKELHVSMLVGSDRVGGVPLLRLAEFITIGQSLPPLDKLYVTEDSILAHSESVGIIESLACPTEASVIALRSSGLNPVKLQTLCINLIEESRLPGMIEVWIEFEGDEKAHSAAHPEPHAWIHATHSLELMRELRDAFPHRLDFGIITTLTDTNYSNLREFNDRIRRHPNCRHIFELPWSGGEGAWGISDDAVRKLVAKKNLPPGSSRNNLLRELREIQRANDWRDRQSHLALERALEMHAGQNKKSPCESAGSTIAALYGDGGLALCELTRPALNLRDYEFNFAAAWNSDKAHQMRKLITSCSCSQPCYLARNLEATFTDRLALLRHL